MSYKEHLDKAKQGLEKHDFPVFMENTAVAKYLCQDDQSNYKEVLEFFLRGLYKFNAYRRAYEVVDELLPMLEGEEKYLYTNTKGVLKGQLGDYASAVDIFDMVYEEVESPDLKIRAINNLAWTYIYLYKTKSEPVFLDKALEACNNGKDIIDQLNDPVSKKKLFTNLGTIKWYMEEYQEALESFRMALEHSPDDPGIYNNIASTYAQTGDWDKAEENLHQAELLADKTNNNLQKASTYRIRAEIAEMKEDFLRAVDYYVVAHDEFSKGQAMVESHECAEKADALMERVRRETGEVIRKNLLLRQERNFGSDYKISL